MKKMPRLDVGALSARLGFADGCVTHGTGPLNPSKKRDSEKGASEFLSWSRSLDQLWGLISVNLYRMNLSCLAPTDMLTKANVFI